MSAIELTEHTTVCQNDLMGTVQSICAESGTASVLECRHPSSCLAQLPATILHSETAPNKSNLRTASAGDWNGGPDIRDILVALPSPGFLDFLRWDVVCSGSRTSADAQRMAGWLSIHAFGQVFKRVFHNLVSQITAILKHEQRFVRRRQLTSQIPKDSHCLHGANFVTFGEAYSLPRRYPHHAKVKADQRRAVSYFFHVVESSPSFRR